MKSVLIKLFIILSVILLLNTTICSVTINANDTLQLINTIGTGDGLDTSQGDGGMKAIRIVVGSIVNVLRIAGAAIAVCILLVIATKYIIASAGDRADIKKYAVNYVIGALIFFSASAILTIIKDFIIDATEG